MDQGPNSRFDLASGRLDRVQFIFFLKSAGDLIEARVAGTLLSLPAIPNPQFASGRGVGPNMKRSSSSLHSSCLRAAARIIWRSSASLLRSLATYHLPARNFREVKKFAKDGIAVERIVFLDPGVH
jgi:hypothetical protein